MRTTLHNDSTTPNVDRVRAELFRQDELLLELTFSPNPAEKSHGALDYIATSTEAAVRRIAKDFFPGARGLRLVIHV